MTIKGLQKTTLLDFPGKLACTVFTSGCNLRCPFCHNASLVLNSDGGEKISLSDFFSYIEKRRTLLDGVCVTGGEPLINHDISEFIAKIRELGLLVKLDTNGCFPDELESLLCSGLVDYVAMDIKNAKNKYPQTVGIKNFEVSRVEKSIDIIMKKAPDYEFRTTVVKELHTKDDIEHITEWIKGANKYFLQKYVDSGDIISSGLSAYSDSEMLNLLAAARLGVPATELRGV